MHPLYMIYFLRHIVNKVCGTEEKDLTFRSMLGMINIGIQTGSGRLCIRIYNQSERMVYFMKSLNKVLTIIGCVTAVIGTVAVVVAVLSYFDRKKQDAELEEYLEGSIQ